MRVAVASRKVLTLQRRFRLRFPEPLRAGGKRLRETARSPARSLSTLTCQAGPARPPVGRARRAKGLPLDLPAAEVYKHGPNVGLHATRPRNRHPTLRVDASPGSRRIASTHRLCLAVGRGQEQSCGPMRIAPIVQSRMSSKRLPGKVLRPLAGRPMLDHVLERLARCPGVERPIVATSTEASDDPIARRCHYLGVTCHRGPLDNVAARFLSAAEEHHLDAFVRVCGDSPLLDSIVVERVVAAFESGVDLATNVWPRTFPHGFSTEVVRLSTFRRALSRFETDHDREHVTSFFYRNSAHFEIANVESGRDLGDIQLAVDSADDLERVQRILDRLTGPADNHDLEAILAVLEVQR